MNWHTIGTGHEPRYWSTQMPPQHAGEISMRKHSGEQMQPLPTHVPAMVSGERSVESLLPIS
eukprot:CAMPEP_0119074184 /NCGR_PEP_ID=MMETSP1178-20130426/71953_1 /TAXON_ID=33656 /ORGANISM="unid sp, Strain CCMP2000" /LENGTH=61 /DNA_ID=CAMNT_0007056321 /DNA_START=420 /DNA_END=605 /DNA_ORIENTATION=-